MARGRRGRATVEVEEPSEAPQTAPSPEVGEDTPEVAPAAPAPAQAAAARRGRARGPQEIGARRFFGARIGQDPIVRAFVSVDKSEHGNRKLSREEWVKAYQSFCSAPR